MKTKISMMDVFKNPRYRGKHVILAAGKLYTAKTGEGAAEILKRLEKTHPDAIPEVAYLPKAHSLILWMIVDSGADYSILPRHISEKLRISLEKDCIKDVTRGVGGEQTVYLCKSKIQAKIGSLERNVPLAFLDSDEVPPLLGRLGFLETFDIEFLKTHSVVFKD